MGRKSLCTRAKTHLYVSLLLLIFLLLFPICVTLCIPVYLTRWVVAMARKLFRPDLGKMINTRSTVIATDDPSHNPQWNLVVWITLEQHLDFDQFRDNFLKDIVLKRDSKGDLLHPEFQQYFHTWLGFLFWKWEKAFDIHQHMRFYDQHSKDNYRDKITTEEELRNIVKDLTATPFGEKTSPWEFLYLPNYVDNEEVVQVQPTNKSVLIFRVHHGFCDGFTILWLLLKEVNKNRGWERVAKPRPVGKTWGRKLLEGSLFWVTAPYHFVKLMVKSRDKNEWHLPLNELDRPFNTSFTHRISLNYIKNIKNGNGVSFTAVVMAALTGGLRQVMIDKGIKIPSNVSSAIGIPMPGHPLKLRNHFIFSFLSLPVGTCDARERLDKIERRFQKLKRSSATLFTFMMVPLFGGLFTWMMGCFSSNKFSTVLTSNFPGPPDTANFIAGGSDIKVLDMNFSAGMGEGNVGIGFCMMSYADGMRIVTSVAKSILPTDEAVGDLNRKILEEFEILKHLSWDV